MTDGWGRRAIPQRTLIPSLQEQYQGIIGFADSQDEILLRVCTVVRAMQYQPAVTWVKTMVLLETIDFGIY